MHAESRTFKIAQISSMEQKTSQTFIIVCKYLTPVFVIISPVSSPRDNEGPTYHTTSLLPAQLPASIKIGGSQSEEAPPNMHARDNLMCHHKHTAEAQNIGNGGTKNIK